MSDLSSLYEQLARCRRLLEDVRDRQIRLNLRMYAIELETRIAAKMPPSSLESAGPTIAGSYR